ncbi:MAG: hypothetical protein ACOVO7_04075, partial [Microcystis aeruginosa]
ILRNVNLNILKLLESIDNCYLSLSKIGLEVRSQYSGVSIQESVFRSQETGDYFYLFFPHPTPHTLHPTPHTLHPTLLP